MRLLFGESQTFKHFLLNVVLMNSDTAAAKFRSVQNNIVSFGTHSARICVNELQILFHRHSKRMVHSCVSALLLRPFQQRELGDPHKSVVEFIQKTKLISKLQTKRAKYVADHFELICRKDNQVSLFCSDSFDELLQFFLGKELSKRTLHGSV